MILYDEPASSWISTNPPTVGEDQAREPERCTWYLMRCIHGSWENQQMKWLSHDSPYSWKKENGTPIFKKDKKEDPGNYRPVHLPSIHGEVREPVILEYTCRHAKDKVTRSSWCGFMKRSCLTNLMTTCDETPGLVDEMRAVDISCLALIRLSILSSIMSLLTNWWSTD